MSKQMTLFARARRTDPQTSHDAAADASMTLQQREQKVIECLVHFPSGLTTAEIGDHAGLPRDSISPRMKPLESKGRVRRTDLRRNRKIVWIAT